jgi:lysophospholipase L1-like esterase
MKLAQIFRNKIKEFLLLFFSTALSLYLVWTFLVMRPFSGFHGSSTRFDSELGWSTIYNHTRIEKGRKFTTNSLGFRSEEVDLSRDHILLIGDSVIWGLKVDDKEHVAYLLGEKINAYQILNLGVNGYGIDQEYLLLKRNIDKLNPKLIVVIICTANDVTNTTSDESYGKSKPLFIVGEEILDQYSGQADTVDSNNLVLASPLISRYSCTNLSYYIQFWRKPKSYCPPKTLGEKEATYVMTGLIKKMKHLAKKHHSELLFVLSPSRLLVDEQTSELTKLEYFKRLLDLTSSEYLDFYKYIKKRNFNGDDIFIDNTHYSPLGHQIFADAIYNFINSKEKI